MVQGKLSKTTKSLPKEAVVIEKTSADVWSSHSKSNMPLRVGFRQGN